MRIVKDKALYSEFCKNNSQLPVYLNDWCLDAACGANNWDALIYLNNKDIYAVFPYYFSNIKLIGRKISMPKTIPYMGIFFNLPSQFKMEKRLTLEKKISKELVDALPPFKYLNLRLHSSVKNWLPFYWMNFTQQTRYTYVLKNISNLDEIHANFKGSVRTDIKKATKNGIAVEVSDDIEGFYSINKKSFDRQGVDVGYSLAEFKTFDKAFKEKKARTILVAKDKEGKIHSAIYLTHDGLSANTHLIGEDPDLRRSSAGTLLIWESIIYTKEKLGLNEFNFEGSMIEQIEKTKRAFGAEQVPFHRLTKVNSLALKLGLFIKELR